MKQEQTIPPGGEEIFNRDQWEINKAANSAPPSRPEPLTKEEIIRGVLAKAHIDFGYHEISSSSIKALCDACIEEYASQFKFQPPVLQLGRYSKVDMEQAWHAGHSHCYLQTGKQFHEWIKPYIPSLEPMEGEEEKSTQQILEDQIFKYLEQIHSLKSQLSGVVEMAQDFLSYIDCDLACDSKNEYRLKLVASLSTVSGEEKKND